MQSLLPGLASRFPPSVLPAQLFSARCWTFVPAATAAAGLQVYTPPASPLLAPGQSVAAPSARLTVGGWTAGASSQGSSLSPPQQSMPAFTGVTPPGPLGLFVLVVAEWQNLTVDLLLSVAAPFGIPVAVTPQIMVLPILVRGVAPSLDFRVSVPGVGPAGEVSRAFLPAVMYDVQPLVQYDMSGLPLLGVNQSVSDGLCGTFSYPGVSLGPMLRYVQSDGYLAALASGLQSYTFREVDDVVSDDIWVRG